MQRAHSDDDYVLHEGCPLTITSFSCRAAAPASLLGLCWSTGPIMKSLQAIKLTKNSNLIITIYAFLTTTAQMNSQL